MTYNFLYKDDTILTIENHNVCGHKHQNYLYVNIEGHTRMTILLTIENPDVRGHEHQICIYFDIKLPVQGYHHSQIIETPDL